MKVGDGMQGLIENQENTAFKVSGGPVTFSLQIPSVVYLIIHPCKK